MIEDVGNRAVAALGSQRARELFDVIERSDADRAALDNLGPFPFPAGI